MNRQDRRDRGVEDEWRPGQSFEAGQSIGRDRPLSEDVKKPTVRPPRRRVDEQFDQDRSDRDAGRPVQLDAGQKRRASAPPRKPGAKRAVPRGRADREPGLRGPQQAPAERRRK